MENYLFVYYGREDGGYSSGTKKVDGRMDELV